MLARIRGTDEVLGVPDCTSGTLPTRVQAHPAPLRKAERRDCGAFRQLLHRPLFVGAGTQWVPGNRPLWGVQKDALRGSKNPEVCRCRFRGARRFGCPAMRPCGCPEMLCCCGCPEMLCCMGQVDGPTANGAATGPPCSYCSVRCSAALIGFTLQGLCKAALRWSTRRAAQRSVKRGAGHARAVPGVLPLLGRVAREAPRSGARRPARTPRIAPHPPDPCSR